MKIAASNKYKYERQSQLKNFCHAFFFIPKVLLRCNALKISITRIHNCSFAIIHLTFSQNLSHYPLSFWNECSTRIERNYTRKVTHLQVSWKSGIKCEISPCLSQPQWIWSTAPKAMQENKRQFPKSRMHILN